MLSPCTWENRLKGETGPAFLFANTDSPTHTSSMGKQHNFKGEMRLGVLFAKTDSHTHTLSSSMVSECQVREHRFKEEMGWQAWLLW